MQTDKKELYTAKRSSNINVEEDVAGAWEHVRSDDRGENWLLCKVLTGTTSCTLHGTGTNGLPELLAALTQDEIFYGAIRVTIRGQVKFFHVYFVGEDVGGMKKGKGALWKAGILQALEGAHGELALDGASPVEEAKRQISSLSGGASDGDIVLA